MRPVGSQKVPGSGRKKGSKNRNAIPCQELADKLGINPFEVLLRFAAGDWKGLGYDKEEYVTRIDDYRTYYKWTIDPSVRAKAAGDAVKYLHNQLRSMEVKGDLGIKVTIEDYTKKEP